MKEMLWDYAPVTGTYRHCPDDVKLHRYRLQVWGPGGFAEDVVEVNVLPRKDPR
jgi:hypothetical protein